jgi:hypothetical protein
MRVDRERLGPLESANSGFFDLLMTKRPKVRGDPERTAFFYLLGREKGEADPRGALCSKT